MSSRNTLFRQSQGFEDDQPTRLRLKKEAFSRWQIAGDFRMARDEILCLFKFGGKALNPRHRDSEHQVADGGLTDDCNQCLGLGRPCGWSSGTFSDATTAWGLRSH